MKYRYYRIKWIFIRFSEGRKRSSAHELPPRILSCRKPHVVRFVWTAVADSIPWKIKKNFMEATWKEEGSVWECWRWRWYSGWRLLGAQWVGHLAPLYAGKLVASLLCLGQVWNSTKRLGRCHLFCYRTTFWLKLYSPMRGSYEPTGGHGPHLGVKLSIGIGFAFPLLLIRLARR